MLAQGRYTPEKGLLPNLEPVFPIQISELDSCGLQGKGQLLVLCRQARTHGHSKTFLLKSAEAAHSTQPALPGHSASLSPSV